MAHDLHMMAPWDLFWWKWQVLPAMWMERMAWVEPVEPWHLHLDFAAEALEAAFLKVSSLWNLWNLLCFKGFAFFTLQLRQSQHVHSPTYPFSKTKRIWIEPQVGGIDIWALQKLVTLHSGIQTTHRPQPKNPRPPQCGSIETPQKEGFIDLQHRAEQSVPISQFVKIKLVPLKLFQKKL